MRKKVFACIFVGLKNEHLSKDIGLFGNAFAETADVKPVIVCYPNNNLPSLKTEAKNLSIHFLQNTGRILFFERAVFNYLKQDAKKIDCLQVQQLNKANIYLPLLYKLFHPKGKVLLKMDMHLSDLEKGINYSKKKWFNFIHKVFEKKMLTKIDLIAVDSPDLLLAYEKKHPYVKDKLVVFSQSLNDKFLNEHFSSRKTFQQKENIILTTGRIGAQDKNYEMLLNTLPLIDLKDWKVIFVGGIHNNFDEKVNQLLEKHSHLKGKIELTGMIDDRLTLYEYYNRSKVFCLTSELESFGMAYIEALYFGNYIIGTTGMSSFDYISNYGELGKKVAVNDVKELARCLNNIIQNDDTIAGIETKAQQYTASKFYVSKNVQVLKKLMA